MLRCRTSSSEDFVLYGATVNCHGEKITGVDHDSLRPDDEIEDGLLIRKHTKYVYPIRHGVLSVHADNSVDLPA